GTCGGRVHPTVCRRRSLQGRYLYPRLGCGRHGVAQAHRRPDSHDQRRPVVTGRVAVVGAGVIGLCSAYYLAREGHEVVVYERDTATRASTSFGNAGMIVPSHFVPLAAPGVIGQALRWLGD